jgi:hypothetical protein
VTWAICDVTAAGSASASGRAGIFDSSGSSGVGPCTGAGSGRAGSEAFADATGVVEAGEAVEVDVELGTVSGVAAGVVVGIVGAAAVFGFASSR